MLELGAGEVDLLTWYLLCWRLSSDRDNCCLSLQDSASIISASGYLLKLMHPSDLLLCLPVFWCLLDLADEGWCLCLTSLCSLVLESLSLWSG